MIVRDILKMAGMLSGVVSRRLTPEFTWNGNSVVECLPEEEEVADSTSARSTNIDAE